MPAAVPQIEVEVKLQRPLLAGYMPHFRIGGGEYLGVHFSTVGAKSENGYTRATVGLMYWPQVNYDALEPGTSFEVLEGPHVIGDGHVLKGQHAI